MHVYCSYSGGVPRASSSSFHIPDEAPPSQLRGSGRKEEVKLLRGGVCRLQKGGGASGFEANEDLVKWFSLGKQLVSRRARALRREGKERTKW